VVSLEYSDDLDLRFAKAVEEAILDIQLKEQVVINLQSECSLLMCVALSLRLQADVIDRTYSSWQRLLDTSSLVLAQRPTGESAWTDVILDHVSA